MGRTPCCDKANVKKGPWSPEEDAKLKDFIEKYGTGGNWIALPQKAGLKRCGKSCRLRWLNYLRPNIKHGDFSEEEDGIICRLFSQIRTKWSVIAAHLPGRTDNDIKNYWNTKLKKKYLAALNNNINNNNPSSQIFPQTPTPLVDPSIQLYQDFYTTSSINMNSSSLTCIHQTLQNIWNNNIPQTLVQETENQWNRSTMQHQQYYCNHNPNSHGHCHCHGQASSESSDGNFSQITQDHNMKVAGNILNYASSSNVANTSSGGFENYHNSLMMQQQNGNTTGNINGGNCYGNMGSVNNPPLMLQSNYDDQDVSYYYYY